MTNKHTTSWGKVSDWYTTHLAGDDTYHAKVIAPNIIRLVEPKEGARILDLACGEGYFSRLLVQASAKVTGVDIAPELIEKAREQDSLATYGVSSAEHLHGIAAASQDVVVCVLAIQNIEKFEATFKEVSRVLKVGGRFIFVLNHPAFRIPKKSSWGFDLDAHTQYRRLDAYLSASRSEIDMTPGRQEGYGKKHTVSFHRSLQDYSKALRAAGLSISRLEEWISHKESEAGPRKDAEDTARKEFPLFLMIEATRQNLG